MNTLKFLA